MIKKIIIIISLYYNKNIMPSVLENTYYKYYVLTDKKTPRKLISSNQATLENTLLKGNDTVTKYLILKAIYQNNNGLPIRKKKKIAP